MAEIERLGHENKLLQEQLSEARRSINAIKSGSIDALVISNEKEISIFTEKNTDQLYRILVEKMNEGALTISMEGIVLYCNSCFAEMVNQPLQKVTGKKFIRFIDETSKQRFELILSQIKPAPFRGQIHLLTYDGKSFPVLMSLNSIVIGQEHLFSVILTDISVHSRDQDELELKAIQLEQKNAELESANKDLTSFTYLSSHDLQEPLRKIQNFVAVILFEEERNLSAAGREYFNRLGMTAKRMQLLIDDLLIYSQTKDSERNFEEVDLKTIVAEVKKDFEEVILEKNAFIDVAKLGYAFIIRLQFRQLIHNLISNSLKFSKPGVRSEIKIKSKIIAMSSPNSDGTLSDNKFSHITYTDNGIGFDPQYSLRIFGVFQRLHSHEKYNGTGIGLAICKRVIENHKGIITASGKMNEGARFDIYIPESDQMVQVI